MFIHWYDKSVRLTGRWSRIRDAAQPAPAYTTTTAAGSYFELAYEGQMALLKFDLGYLGQPFPHLWISVDDGARIEVPVDCFLRVNAPEYGRHVLRVTYKGGCEMLPRWYAPLMGAISFIGAEVDAPADLPEDNRRIIEFVGDSITEGVLIDADYSDKPANLNDQFNRTYQDDNSATYASLTAKALNLRPIFQAYGAVGLTRSGCGSVPRAGLIYPWVHDGVPYTGEKPDIVVINHGANDSAAPASAYLSRYEELLDMVFENTPDAIVVCLSPFCGVFNDDLTAFIPQYNASRGRNVLFVSSKGWVPADPLHPLRDGHRIIADHFIPILKEIIEA